MLRVEHVICIKTCKGVTTMPSIGKFVNVEVLMWRRGGGAIEVGHVFFEARDLGRHLSATNLTLEHCEMNETNVSWKQICFIQLLCCGGNDAHQNIKIDPHIPLFANVGGGFCGSI